MKSKINQPTTKKVAKVPVVMQLETLECGAASLAMILAYYGKWVPLEKVRSDCGVSRDGSKAISIIKAARNYGLEANGYRFEPDALKENGTFPCIIHWNFNHFVVLRGFKGNKVYLNDPARGDCVVTMEEFDKSFTGICLMFRPTENFVPSGKQKSMLSFAKKRLVGAGAATALVVLTTIISSILGVINPAFSRVFLDRLLTGKNPDWFMPFIIMLCVISLVQIIVLWINAIYSLRIDGKLAATGNTSYMWKVLRLPMDFFSQRMAGDIQQRAQTNALIASTLVHTLAPLVIQTVMMVFYLIVMLGYSVLLSVIGITSVLINLLLSRYISKKRVNITRVQLREAGKTYGVALAGIEMIETIKATGAQNGFFAKWAGYIASENVQRDKFKKLNEYMGLVLNFVTGLTNIVVLMLGVWLTIQGEFTVGMIMAFQGFLTSFTGPATMLIEAGQTVQELRTQMERVEDVLEYPSDSNYDIAVEDDNYGKIPGQIDIKNITFGYSKLDEPIIKDFSLSLKPGNKVALVGGSGCGKSTISKLVSGLYKPWSGEILYNGRPITKIPRSVFTGSVAVVDQDIILFEDTIANNIKMWDNTIEDFEMILAARDAHVHDDIMQRLEGYNHKLIEGGKDFSGGQRQRMEIARALAQDPTILILDEATSALDAKTEYEVMKSVTDRGITCLIVAHRLSTIRDCDEIIVLKDGQVIERGTHDELYAQDGYYKELISNE